MRKTMPQSVTIERHSEFALSYENGSKHPSLDTVVDIANALGISVDDLLVDSLEHPISTADSEIHRLLLDCNKIEEQILTKTVAELKKILYGLGI